MMTLVSAARRLSTRVRVVILLVPINSCGQYDMGPNLSRRASPIVGGRPADMSATFGTVAIEDSERNQYCTGTLIGEATVVTAAHCLSLQVGDAQIIELAPQALVVMAGALAVAAAKDSQLYEVSRVILHPAYVGMPASSSLASTLDNIHDLGIVVLKRPVDTLRPIALAAHDDLSSALTIAGYGEAETSEASGNLRIADAQLGARSETEFAIGGPGEPDSCAGDSGGPAYRMGTEPRLVGIASRALKSVSTCGGGGIYTYAPVYADWLREAADVPGPGRARGCAFTGEVTSVSPAPPIAAAALLLRRLRRKRGERRASGLRPERQDT